MKLLENWSNKLIAKISNCALTHWHLDSHFKNTISSYFYGSNLLYIHWNFIEIWEGFIIDNLTLIKVMAWCQKGTSHYLSQWWCSALTHTHIYIYAITWANDDAVHWHTHTHIYIYINASSGLSPESIQDKWLHVIIYFNSSPPGQNGHHFANNIFWCIYMNEKFCVLTKISLKFVPEGPIDNKPSIGLDNGLATNRWQAIIYPNVDPVHWCIYAAPGGDELIIMGSDNGFSPVQRQAISWTNDDLLSIGPLGTNFSELWIEINKNCLKKMLDRRHFNFDRNNWSLFLRVQLTIGRHCTW